MTIIHYLHGIPPVISGGMVKYVFDLAEMQQQCSNKVYILYPGKLFCDQKTVIKNKKYSEGLHFLEIINALPVPMGKGILDIDMYTKSCDIELYNRMLKEIKPDILHIHSFMGLHRELLEACKARGVKIVYTSHDYFGLCPIGTLLNQGEQCEDCNWTECGMCCKNALSQKKLRMRQSKLFQLYKGSTIIALLKKSKFIMNFVMKLKNRKKEGQIKQYQTNIDYTILKNYYNSMFALVDKFLFNSSLAEETYQSRIHVNKGIIIEVRHANICDNRRTKIFGSKLKLTYLGDAQEYKGFAWLKKVLDMFYNRGNVEFELNTYFESFKEKSPYLISHGRYHYEQLADIFENTDVLIVPSKWRETYGFVALEAISYGVPVITTENVGAKDLLRQLQAGWIVGNESDSFLKLLEQIYYNRSILVNVNQKICSQDIDFSFKKHYKRIMEEYRLE